MRVVESERQGTKVKVCGLTSNNDEVIQRRDLSGRFPPLGRGTQRRGMEPATLRLRDRRANHYTTSPPKAGYENADLPISAELRKEQTGRVRDGPA